MEDKATKQVDKITKFTDRKFSDLGVTVKGLADSISEWGNERGSLAKGVAWLGSSFVEVIGGNATHAAQIASEAIGGLAKGLTTVLAAPLKWAEKGLRGMFGGAAEKAEETVSAAKKAGETLIASCESQAECAKKVNDEVKKTRFGLRGAVVEAGGLAKNFMTMGGVFEKMGGMGGIAGVLLGPLAPLLGLFKPLLNMIVKLLMPALETFTAIMETAFAPLAMTLEIIARNLATKLVPLLAPFVAMLELVAVQIGTHIMKALEGVGGLAGPIMKAFNGLMPVVMTLVSAFTKLAMKLLPVVVSLFDTLAPIAIELVTMLAETMVPIVEMFGEIVGELGPPLVKLVGTLLKAFMPLIPPLLELYMVLYTQIFGPVLMQAIKGVIMLVSALLPPFVKLVNWLAPNLMELAKFIGVFADAFAIGFGKIGEWLENFITAVFIGFSPSLKDVFEFIPDAIGFVIDALESLADIFERVVKIIVDGFVKPVIEGFTHIATRVLDWTETMFNLLWNAKDDVIEFVLNIDKIFLRFLNETLPRIWTGFWKWVVKTFTMAKTYVAKIWGEIVTALGIDSAGTRLRGIVSSLLAAIRVPMLTIARFINDNVIEPANDILGYDPPGPGGKLSEIIGLGKNYQIPDISLAKGGIVEAREGGINAQIGEGGADELVMPLRADTVERVLAPLIPTIEFPALQQLSDAAVRIERFLTTGTLRVMPVGGGLTESASNDQDNLGDAVGLEGMGW